MKKLVSVDALTVGMYVNRITKMHGTAVMKSQGIIKSEAGIQRLKSLKVTEVEVDLDKSEIPEEERACPDPVIEDTPASSETPTPLNQELQKAQRIYERARETQHKAFDQLRSEGKLDATPYLEIASEFLDSIFRNQDALLCMTKLQDKDAYLFEHSINVAILMGIFARHLRLKKEIGLKLTLGGLLHDIGKVRVPDAVLHKQGKLTREEFEQIKQHPTYGADILSDAGMDGLTIQIALQHHERLSGSGYPQGLIGLQLNQYVRMSGIVDAFDAITAQRVYKPGMSAAQAIKILKQAESEFDPDLVNQFVRATGLFSIGSLVLMTSGKLAIVIQTNYLDPLSPMVTTFYHPQYKRHIEPLTLDLCSKQAKDSIDKVVNATDYDIDINAVIDRYILQSFL